MSLTDELLNDVDEETIEAGEHNEKEPTEDTSVNEDGASEASANESKADKFLRLAPPRVDKVIKSIESLKKLSAHGSYEYTSEQATKMFTAIRSELDACEAAFKPEKETKGFSF